MTKETFIELYNFLNADSEQTKLTPEMFDELWPEESRRQLANAFEGIAKRIEIYKERAANMTEEEAVSFLTGRVKKIPKDHYEEAYEDWGTEPNRQGFVVYMTQNLLHSIEIYILCHKRKEFKTKLKEIIEAYAAEVYPDKEEMKPLPKMPKKPQNYTSAINKLMNELTTKPVVNAGANDMPVSDKNKEITTYVAIAYDKSKDPFNITSKQRTIMEAANAVFKQAISEGMQAPIAMTPLTIFKALPGGSSKATPSKLKEIEETMSLFRDMSAEIDATMELRAAGKIGKGDKFHIKTNMILAREAKFTRSNGTKTIGWQVFEPPVACVYAEKMKQVVSCPAWVLEVREVDDKTGKPGALVSVNDNRRELLAYMFRRVGVMLNAYRKAKNAETLKRNKEAGRTWHTIMTAPKEVGGYSTSDTILYETAFKAAEIETKRKNTIAELRDYCLKVLTYWKAGGYIYDFNELKKGKERRGVKIIFEPPTTE